MSLMVSYNLACKRKDPDFYANTKMIRLNSPWYTLSELKKILKTTDKPKFMDINLKRRRKPVVAHHHPIKLLHLVGKYNIEWVAISNIEGPEQYDKVRKLLGNNTTKICAKVETSKGCKNIKSIIDKYDGIMVDVEDLAFEVGWKIASKEKERIYDLCQKYKKPHFRLAGVLFDYIHPTTTVYTYGVWDLLHPGHQNMLEKAKAYGDRLIVGVVRDKPVEKLKGKGKPVQSLKDRLRNIQCVKCVDLAVVQDTYDPVPNLKKYKPNVLVKGNDWKYIPGQEWAKKNNCKLVQPAYSQGWSSTDIMRKIKHWEDKKGNKKEMKEHERIYRMVHRS